MHDHQLLWNKMLLKAWKANVGLGILVRQFQDQINDDDFDSLEGIRRTPRISELREPVRAFVSKHAGEPLNAALWNGRDIDEIEPVFLQYKWFNRTPKTNKNNPKKVRLKVRARELNTSRDWKTVS